jgi:hypothetical protein
MMKQKNIQQLGCLLCIAILLAGCALYPKWLPHPQEWLGYGNGNWTCCFDLEVDGRLYWCSHTDMYEDGKHDLTYIHATLLSAEHAKKYSEIKVALDEATEKGKKPMVVDSSSPDEFGEWMLCKFIPSEMKQNYFQIIDGETNEILFEIPLEELDICTRRGDWRRFSEEKLKEVMTRLIRENVRRQ